MARAPLGRLRLTTEACAAILQAVDSALSMMLADQRRRARDAAEAATAWRSAIEARLPELVTWLHDRGATEVVLFGSLARGEAGPSSDVDLAVGGLPPEHQFRAHAVAARLLQAEVDLIRFEDAPAALVDHIRAEGQKLGGL